MLEIRNVTKIYRSKAGNEVKALDNVSISFPEKGMVFVLGKSGSGKSTLLNVIGGLDDCNRGEFIIKGKSSKDFSGSDFDAYRNTFIGFIFQEYNILDDFTVGANIGLALELQGKKATNEKINEILNEVELSDYAKRKPNELSGGQKQRIAIARALVKDPEIIMADEPTGALDSSTGKQIFDTLKELSKKKLVIVVSHDRDFAERYADRIIEMKDGRIESDVTKHDVDAQPLSDGIIRMNDNLLKIKKGYRLTAEDVELINEYLSSRESDILVSGDKRLNDNVRAAAGISQDNKSFVFDTTDPEKDVKLKEYDGKQTKFIHSRLPIKNAVKMSKSSLGHKKFRLVMTVFLSLVAFTLFGFADTLGAYDKYVAGTTSMTDTNIKNASFRLGVKYKYYYDGELQSTGYSESMFNEKDISILNDKLGMSFTPVFNGSQSADRTISLMGHMANTSNIGGSSAYTGELYGFVSLPKEQLDGVGYTIYGMLPEKSGEIAISKFMYEQLNFTGFRSNMGGESVNIDAGSLTYSDSSNDANSIIGKSIQLNVGYTTKTFKITAVIDTQFEYDRYDSFIPKANTNERPDEDDNNALLDMIMLSELKTTLHYGFHCLGYVVESDIIDMSRDMETWGSESNVGEYLNINLMLKNDRYIMYDNLPYTMYINLLGTSSDIASLKDVLWVDGTPRSKLSENEMLIDIGVLNEILSNNQTNVYPKLCAKAEELIGPYDTAMYPNPMEALANYAYSQEENPEKLLAEYVKAVLKDVFKINTDEYINVPDMIYAEMTDSFWFYEENGGYVFNCSASTVRDMIAKLYSANVIYAEGSEVHRDDAFINAVISDNYKDAYLDPELGEDDKLRLAFQAYYEYLLREYKVTSFGDLTYFELNCKVTDSYLEVMGTDLVEFLEGTYLSSLDYETGEERETRYDGYKVVGLFVDPNNSEWGGGDKLIISDTFAKEYEKLKMSTWYTETAEHEAGIYAFAIAPMPEDRDIIKKMVELSYDTDGDLQFHLKNQVMDTLDNFNSFIEVGAKVFVYIGLGFAVFASLMMMNFISTSISYKKREIGILRAVGARSSDVFKIFFSEALIIALINYALSLVTTIVTVNVFNTAVRNEGINVTLLNFGIRQIALMLGISVFVALLASFLPVWNIARRKPVDAIKNK